IVARTHIANGAPNAHDTAEAHGAPLGKDEIAATKKALGWDPEKHFYVPDAVYTLFKERAADNAKDREQWNTRIDGWKKGSPEVAKAWEAFLAKHVPSDLYEQLLKALPEKEDATRNLSNALQQVVAKAVPSLIGGSADLAPSTKTLIKGSGSVGRGKFEGRNLHFGIREHGMGAICNGMALYGGGVPYGGTVPLFRARM